MIQPENWPRILASHDWTEADGQPAVEPYIEALDTLQAMCPEDEGTLASMAMGVTRAPRWEHLSALGVLESLIQLRSQETLDTKSCAESLMESYDLEYHPAGPFGGL